MENKEENNKKAIDSIPSDIKIELQDGIIKTTAKNIYEAATEIVKKLSFFERRN